MATRVRVMGEAVRALNIGVSLLVEKVGGVSELGKDGRAAGGAAGSGEQTDQVGGGSGDRQGGYSQDRTHPHGC